MGDQLKITYQFSFEGSGAKDFDILLDREKLEIIRDEATAPPAWAELGRNRCSDCPLDEKTVLYCPIAINLARMAQEFREHYAYEKVRVTVTTEERSFAKDTIIQEGLGSMLGIIMAASGCPVMGYFRPMVRFHLPFASLQETFFRMASVYLLSQYFLKQDGREPDWDLSRIEEIYSRVGRLNRDFSERVAEAARKDASINALVNLDCFAQMVPLAADEILGELKPYFSAY